MTFIVGSPCVGCKDTECVSICPVDCFYEGPNMLVIDPDECIDCAVCAPECPIDAILETEDDDPKWTEINAQLAEAFMQNDAVEARQANEPPRKPENQLR